MEWLWIVLAIVVTPLVLLAGFFFSFYWFLRLRFLHYLVRIFQEKPLFIIPRGQPIPNAEELTFTARDGLSLRGLYLKTDADVRRGVILFGLEYGSNRWACVPYCDFLRKNGYDIFTFEVRGQGDSDPVPGYEPLQWVTDFEVHDFHDAVNYLKSRPDAAANGVGLFGISKGGGAGLIAASRENYIRCFVTDGAFATHSTMVPYMRKWIQIYSNRRWLQRIVPIWLYSLIARAGLQQTQKLRGCRFPHLEHALPKLAPRPFLLIHGEGDTYIKPDMARDLFNRCRQPKEFWLVPKARHNQAFHLAAAEYQQRVLEFFDRHLAGREPAAAPAPAVPASQPEELLCRIPLASSPATTRV